MKKLKLPKRGATPTEESSEAASDTPAPLKTKPGRGPRPAAIQSSWTIFRAAVGDFIADWRPYTKILLTGAVPIAALSLANATDADPTTAAYISVFTMIVNITLVWSINYRFHKGAVPDLRTAYYDASRVIVRFLLTFFRLLLVLIPAAIGSAIYQFFANELVTYGDINSFQATIAIIIAALLWVPTFYWLCRRVMSLFVVISEDKYPGAAWRRSQAMTAGRFWVVARHLVLFVLFGFLVAIPATLLLFIFTLVRLPLVADLLFQFAATLTILPIGYLYLYKLYRELDKTAPSPTAAESQPKEATA